MQKKLMTEYDSTKKMLNTLRKLNESTSLKKGNVINEQSQEQRISTDSNPSSADSSEVDDSIEQSIQSSHMQIKDDITAINGVDVKLLSSDEMDMKLSEEQKESISGVIDNFKSQVTQIVDFKPGMTINEKQVRLDGKIYDLDIKFTIIAGEEAGVYVNADMLKLEETKMVVLDKLLKFELPFKQTFEPFIDQRQNN